MVAVALGDGFATILKELNIDQIVDGGQTMNPSIDDLAQAVERTNAKNVFILPNNTNIILAAQQAAELTDKNVIVLPTKSVPMGISAALAFNPEADVETNIDAMNEAAEKKEKTAVAISYEPGEKAPKILATGKGQVAEKIIETAKENQVPTYKDNKLAATLSKLQIGEMIPPELYEVVAEILVFVDDMDRMKAKLDHVGVHS